MKNVHSKFVLIAWLIKQMIRTLIIDRSAVQFS